jgi:FtsZ-interacting cell division protein ZipA
MTTFEWFLLIVIVIVVPLIIAVVVTLWTIDQANKRKRANRNDAQIGVKRNAALSPEEVAARKAARAEREADAATVTINNVAPDAASSETLTSRSGNTVTINNVADDGQVETDTDASQARPGRTI